MCRIEQHDVHAPVSRPALRQIIGYARVKFRVSRGGQPRRRERRLIDQERHDRAGSCRGEFPVRAYRPPATGMSSV